MTLKDPPIIKTPFSVGEGIIVDPFTDNGNLDSRKFQKNILCIASNTPF